MKLNKTLLFLLQLLWPVRVSTKTGTNEISQQIATTPNDDDWRQLLIRCNPILPDVAAPALTVTGKILILSPRSKPIPNRRRQDDTLIFLQNFEPSAVLPHTSPLAASIVGSLPRRTDDLYDRWSFLTVKLLFVLIASFTQESILRVRLKLKLKLKRVDNKAQRNEQ